MTNLKKKILIYAVLFVIPIMYLGCDDSGYIVQSPKSAFSHSNLPPLGSEENATYELFVSFSPDSLHSDLKYCSMGKFYISPTYQAIDYTGAPMDFKFDFTPDMSKSVDAIITIEPKPDNDTLPNGPVLLGGIKSIVNTVYVFNFNMDYISALGLVADQFLTDSAKFILASPTAGFPSMQCTKGVWFATDSTGNSQGISCANLPDSLKWIYHAYLVDSRDTINGIYNIGRFQNPGSSDDYSSCNGTGGQSWVKPGQDWMQANCPGNGLHDIDGSGQYSLNNGDYKLLITLEPKNRTASTPFFLKIFYGNIPAGTTFNQLTNLPNVFPSYKPRADISISSNNSK